LSKNKVRRSRTTGERAIPKLEEQTHYTRAQPSVLDVIGARWRVGGGGGEKMKACKGKRSGGKRQGTEALHYWEPTKEKKEHCG